MTDPLTITYLVVIGLCVPPAAYLLPQDRAVARLVEGLGRRHQHRQLRRWVDHQRTDRASQPDGTSGDRSTDRRSRAVACSPVHRTRH